MHRVYNGSNCHRPVLRQQRATDCLRRINGKTQAENIIVEEPQLSRYKMPTTEYNQLKLWAVLVGQKRDTDLRPLLVVFVHHLGYFRERLKEACAHCHISSHKVVNLTTFLILHAIFMGKPPYNNRKCGWRRLKEACAHCIGS